MTILTATPETLLSVVKGALKPGDMVQLAAGDYGALRTATWPSGTLTGITFDLTAASITGWDLGKLADCRFVGGKLTAAGTGSALVISNSTGISVEGAHFVAGLAGYGYGVAAENVSNLKVTGNTFEGFRAGLKLGHIRGADIGRNEFIKAGSDGVNMGDCADIDIHNNWFWKFAPLAGNHPDSVQCNTATDRYPRCARITVRDNVIEGECQGMLIRDADTVVVARNSICAGQPTAIGVQNCTNVTIDSNGYLRTLETALYQAHIDTRGSTGVVFKGFNEAPAFKNTAKASYPATVQ